MQNRRNFLNTLVRAGIFSSLALLSGIFIHRWGESDDCNKNFACANCNISDRCQLPEADKYRFEKARVSPTKSDNGRSGK